MRYLVFLFGIVFTPLLKAQVGGNSTYQFLNLPNSAHVTAMGGSLIASHSNDVSLAYQNPALLNKSMHHNMALNWVNYFSGIQYGYFSVAQHFKSFGTVSTGIHYMDYGTFTQADETGEKLGTFYASQYALHISWSTRLTSDTTLSVGIAFKPILSYYEQHRSGGFAFDAGLAYHNPETHFSASLVMRNMGKQVLAYSENDYMNLPFEVLIGLSQKLMHAPFLFSVVARHVNHPDLTFELPSEQRTISILGDDSENQESVFFTYGDYVLRHLIFGAEMSLTENLFLRAGYNHLRRKELNYNTDFFTTVGLSWGFGLKIRKFHLSYARAMYHLAGSPNHFSLTTNLDELYNWIR